MVIFYESTITELSAARQKLHRLSSFRGCSMQLNFEWDYGPGCKSDSAPSAPMDDAADTEDEWRQLEAEALSSDDLDLVADYLRKTGQAKM